MQRTDFKIIIDFATYRGIYVSVNLCNKAIRELTENFRQFVNFLKILGNLL